MGRVPGRRVVMEVWLLVAVDLLLVLVTYSRLPADELYNVSGTGLEGGLSRALVEANFPAALIAIAVLLAVAPKPRWLAIVAGLMCLVVAVPNVVDQDNLDAKPVNAIAAVGVLLALVLSIRAEVPPARPAGPLRIALAVTLALICAEWIAAALGFYLDGVPLLGWVFQTGRPITAHGAAAPGRPPRNPPRLARVAPDPVGAAAHAPAATAGRRAPVRPARRLRARQHRQRRLRGADRRTGLGTRGLPERVAARGELGLGGGARRRGRDLGRLATPDAGPRCAEPRRPPRLRADDHAANASLNASMYAWTFPEGPLSVMPIGRSGWL